MSEERETTNYLRLVSFYIDVGTEAVYDVFIFSIPNSNKDVVTFLSKSENQSKIFKLRKDKIVSLKQFNILTGTYLNARKIDISLLIILLSNLFDGIIEPPKTGWANNKPAQLDLTLGADLVRLRKYRNKIVGHMPRAKISDCLFDAYWNDLGKIFVRIYDKIDSTKKTEVTQNIEIYRTRNLDQQAGEHYTTELNNLRDKCEDVVQLQETVEKLIAETNEFYQFFRNPPKRYSRYIRLLFEGGQFVLLKFLEIECDKERQDVQTLIETKKALLKTELVHRDALSQLENRPDRWDLLVLATVVLTLFSDKIGAKTAKLIRHILEERRNYAESAIESLNEGKFASRCEHLTYSLRTLSSSLGDEVEAKCTEYIDKGIDDITNESFLEQLTAHGLKIKSLSDIYQEKMHDLKESMEQMEEAGIDFIKDHVLQLKMITLGNDEEKKQLAEETLATVWNAALDGSETPSEFASVRLEVDKILDSIKKNAGNRAGHIQRKCIILSIRCFSCRGVIELLDYLGSTLFQEQFFTLSDELSSVYGEVIVISARLTLDSLLTALDNPAGTHTSDQLSHGLNISISCSSAEGMHQTLNMLSEETTANSLNKISEELSKHVQDTISLKVIPDLQNLSGVFDIQGTHSTDQLSHGLNVSISCSSAEGMHRTLNMLSEETTANSFNKISEELTKNVPDTVSLNVIPDLQKLSGVFDIQASASFSSSSKEFLDSEAERASQSQLIESVEDDEQKNMEPYQLPTSFEKLVSNLRWNKQVFKNLQGASKLVEKIRLAMQNEGRQVLMKKAKIMNETNPSNIEVKDFKCALRELLKQFKAIRDDMFDLQAQNRQRIEDCRKHIMQHRSTISQKNQEVDRLKLQSFELGKDIYQCKREVIKQGSLAMERDKAAKRPGENAYSNTIFGVSRSTIMLGVGILFAPLTGGASAIVADAAVELLEAKNLADKLISANCERAAESHRYLAWSKRYDASKLRTERDHLNQRVNKTETEIQKLEIIKEELIEEAGTLREVVRQLNAANDFLNTKITQIQDLEQALTEAEQEGDGFNIIKNAFIRNPLKYKGKAQRCLENLQEKWRCVESGLCLETRYSLRD